MRLVARLIRGRFSLRGGTPRDERGISIVLTALLIVPLLCVAAVVVDIGNGKQQNRQAQAIADSAALAGAYDLGSGVQPAQTAAFKYAFKSLGDTSPPTPPCLATSPCSYTDTGGNKVTVTTPWQSQSSWVHVDVCWNTATIFGPVMKSSSLKICGHASANSVDAGGGSGGGGGGGGAAPSCTHNEISSPSALTGPGGGGTIPSQTISAVYSSSTGVNLDTSKIVFVAPNSAGQMVQLNAPGGASPAYTLTPPGGGTSVTIAYVLPGGLYTASASLFVTDIAGDDCGQAAWSTCPVTSHDDFFEPGAGDQSGGDLLADSDDYVLPTPGSTVTVGSELSVTYYDETQFDASRVVFNVDGAQPAYNLTNDLNVNVAPPADLFAITGDSPLGAIGTPANGVSQVTSPGKVASTSAALSVAALLDYLGDPIFNSTVTATPGAGSAVGGTAITDAQGNATINVTDAVKELVAFTVKATVNGTQYTLGTVYVGFKNKAIGASATSTGGNSPMTWATDLNAHGSGTDANGASRNNSDYLVKVKSIVPSTNGWHSAFIYTYDLDQNQTGGDCTMTQYAFRVGGGTPSGSNALDLVQ